MFSCLCNTSPLRPRFIGARCIKSLHFTRNCTRFPVHFLDEGTFAIATRLLEQTGCLSADSLPPSSPVLLSAFSGHSLRRSTVIASKSRSETFPTLVSCVLSLVLGLCVRIASHSGNLQVFHLAALTHGPSSGFQVYLRTDLSIPKRNFLSHIRVCD
jgi:hypothetical protein